MSVIFKTLKKLKTESADKEYSKNKLVRKKRIYFFQNALYSPSYVFLLLLIITVVGAGTLYGFYHFRETTDENIKDFAAPNSGIQKLADIDTVESTDDKKSIIQESMKDSGSRRIEYIPPESNDSKVEVYGSNKTVDVEKLFITAKKTSPNSKESIKRNAVTKAINGKSAQPLAAECFGGS